MENERTDNEGIEYEGIDLMKRGMNFGVENEGMNIEQ